MAVLISNIMKVYNVFNGFNSDLQAVVVEDFAHFFFNCSLEKL